MYACLLLFCRKSYIHTRMKIEMMLIAFSTKNSLLLRKKSTQRFRIFFIEVQLSKDTILVFALPKTLLWLSRNLFLFVDYINEAHKNNFSNSSNLISMKCIRIRTQMCKTFSLLGFLRAHFLPLDYVMEGKVYLCQIHKICAYTCVCAL